MHKKKYTDEHRSVYITAKQKIFEETRNKQLQKTKMKTSRILAPFFTQTS